VAKEISAGYTDSPVTGFASLDLSLPALNYEEDFRLLHDEPGEVVMTNVTAPIDQPETIRFASRKVGNVYAASDIDPSAYLPTRQGVSTLVETRQVWEETSTTDDSYRKLVPVRCGISITVPSYGALTAEMVEDLILRTVAALYDQADDTSAGIASILRGVLAKAEL
jgi:hypothetical protein